PCGAGARAAGPRTPTTSRFCGDRREGPASRRWRTSRRGAPRAQQGCCIGETPVAGDTRSHHTHGDTGRDTARSGELWAGPRMNASLPAASGPEPGMHGRAEPDEGQADDRNGRTMRAETAEDPSAGLLGAIAGELPPGPRDDEVHAWAVPVDLPPAPPEVLRSVLSADECERADRFRFEDDRRRYVVGRGVLRVLLGRCTGIEPQRLVFGYGAHGKPALAEPGGPLPL